MGTPHRVEETPVFKFDQLSDAAKEKARDWYRQDPIDEWWEDVYERAGEAGKLIGIDFSCGRRKGGHAYAIQFSGFCSQGDGASWSGSYAYKNGAAKAIVKEWPASRVGDQGEVIEYKNNAELQRIAKGLQDVQRRHFYKLEARSEVRGPHYVHSGMMQIEVTHMDDQHRDIGDAEDEIKQLLRDFADWIYDCLESAFDWMNADEQVDENIIGNEYEFYEDGSVT